MEYQTVVLESPDELPPPPSPDRLSISGLSIVFYCAHRIKSARITEAIEEGTLRSFTDSRSYAGKLRPGESLFYSTLIDSGPFPAAMIRELNCEDTPSLRQSVLWFGDEYIVSAVPIILSAAKGDIHALQLAKPLNVDQVINFLAVLSSTEESAALAEQVARGLTANGILAPGDIIETWPLRGSFGMQIWDLSGTKGRITSDLYKGIAESVSYSWEISALLSFNADHLVESELWLRRLR
jgi:hypothetical protein